MRGKDRRARVVPPGRQVYHEARTSKSHSVLLLLPLGHAAILSRPDSAQLADYQWLVGPEADALLAALGHESDPLAVAKRLRGDLSAERVRLVLEQTRLRARARSKFALAERLFFTSLGLEQATDQWVAAYKAQRFGVGAPVVDLCCGIGGDLMALAERGPVVGVDRDPIAALLAHTNCQRTLAARTDPQPSDAAGAFAVETHAADDYRLAAESAWHIDPDRRPEGRRTTHAELHDPPPEAIDRLRTQSEQGAVKLAPAAVVPEGWIREGQLEWISFARQCRQLVVWFGRLASAAGRRSATLVDRQRGPVRSVVGQAGCELNVAPRIGRFVFEPDPAVLAADLTGELAHELALASIAAGAVYLTGDEPLHDPALAAFEVIDVVPLDVKRLKKMLRSGGFGRLEVKKRGVELDPAALTKQLKVPGEHAATLLVTRLEQRVVAILARRSAT